MHKATFKYALNQEKLFMNNFEPKQKKCNLFNYFQWLSLLLENMDYIHINTF